MDPVSLLFPHRAARHLSHLAYCWIRPLADRLPTLYLLQPALRPADYTTPAPGSRSSPLPAESDWPPLESPSTSGLSAEVASPAPVAPLAMPGSLPALWDSLCSCPYQIGRKPYPALQ